MTANIYRLDQVTLPNAENIQQIDASTWNQNVQTILERGAGGTNPTMAATGDQVPTVTFTTSELAKLLAEVPLIGLAVTSALTTYFKHGAPTGNVNRAVATHKQAVINAAYISIDRITLPSNQPQGTADVTITCLFDGTNVPIIITGSVALVGTITGLQMFGAGPIYLNDNLLDGITNIIIEPGLRVETFSSESQQWPTLSSVADSTPVINFTSNDAALYELAGVGGQPLSGTGLVAFGRKYTNNLAGGVARVPDVTAEHLRFAIGAGRFFVETAQGSQRDAIDFNVQVEGTAADESIFPIAYSEAAIAAPGP